MIDRWQTPVVRSCLLSVIMLLGMTPCLPAQEADQDVASSPSSGALSDTIWFDAEQDDLVPVKVKPSEDDSLNRESRWLPKAKRVRVPKTSNTTTGGGNVSDGWFGTELTLGNLFGWLLLVAVVLLVVSIVAYAVSKSDFEFVSGPSSRSGSRPDGPDQQMLERIKHLPPELRRTDVNLRSEAERLMREGSFDQAIILLFAHQLLLLDHAGLLRLNRGKTNRRYIREARAIDRESAERLQATVTAFERSYFGRHSIDAAEFRELWADNQEMERAMQRRQEVAA